MKIFCEGRELLGTWIEIKYLAESSRDDVVSAAFLECKRIEQAYSRFLNDNDLAKLNSAVGQWQEVDEEMFGLLELAEVLTDKTGGVFDIGVKSLLESWGYDSKYSFVVKEDGEGGDVSDAGVQGAVMGNVLAGASLECDKSGCRVRLSRPVELGAVGKGYALDRMVEVLKGGGDHGQGGHGGGRGVENFSVNAGGDLYCQGVSEGGRKWRAAFEHPLDAKKAIGVVEVDGFALACSNPAKRKWKDKHHLVDAQRGRPADDMLAVYTQADSGMIADAYATALFVVGMEKAWELAQQAPVEAMLVSPEGRMFRTEGFRGEVFK